MTDEQKEALGKAATVMYSLGYYAESRQIGALLAAGASDCHSTCDACWGEQGERWPCAKKRAAGASEGQAQPISDFMMDLVDRLGSEADAVDPRAWKHLLVYAPKEGSRQTTVISELKQVTQTPDVSYEHLFALAKMCGLIGPYSIKEVNDRIIGYARVVLNDNAVQEAFVRANEHVLSAEIAALRERIAGMEKEAAGPAITADVHADAARYQWLRDKRVDFDLMGLHSFYATKLWRELGERFDWDDAIDAAIAKEKQG
ncbi:hypothetical protein [Caballeronia cordobensis]|uniref:hypothetical protein n=1 Tax=Caballeronia cordobensis TaxID=1353886 RepID=UPI00045EF31D|nr:putative uncharacterized protein [Burkholderia sp. RPE67]